MIDINVSFSRSHIIIMECFDDSEINRSYRSHIINAFNLFVEFFKPGKK